MHGDSLADSKKDLVARRSTDFRSLTNNKDVVSTKRYRSANSTMSLHHAIRWKFTFENTSLILRVKYA